MNKKKQFVKKNYVIRLMELGYTESEANKICTDFIFITKDALMDGAEVHLYGIGKLVPKVVEPYKKDNCFGKTVEVDKHLKVKFKQSQSLNSQWIKSKGVTDKDLKRTRNLLG